MDTGVDDTTMIRQNVGEYCYARGTAQWPRKRKEQEDISNKKPPSPCWLCGEMSYCRECPYRNHICNVCGKKNHGEAKYRSDIEGEFEKMEVTGNRQQYVALMNNDKRVKLELNTAPDITLTSRKTWRSLSCPVLKPTNNVAQNA
ncbi:unnamed protein product, partial [Hymenolepis diminuta]